MSDCFTCANSANIESLPPREAIVVTDHWRVAHAYNSMLPGWLVALPRRHVTAIHELTAEEMAPLGELLRQLSVALAEVTGCEKTYVMQFAELAAHRHVHFHLVPRMAGFTDDQTGPNVFRFLVDDGSELADDERDAISAEIRRAVARQ